ncbi:MULTISPECIES: acyl-CoA synthetase [unclassified Crossiella]|uniref:acyl-CoA synthetase n=1 Tax=unclassified Crossiella TaxID=2620835 RepID=UPI0020000BC8|nr:MULTISPECIES: acyl-CoA synthetase [unclassified Crossiella]MCK2241971.1 acyl-CoA synthetase [Crossiella sp. S99.2]MCK2255874.1 acyl-CoA synthetase [Crossiella sp. S99.1]
MSEPTGLWQIAQAYPDRIAVVEPDGTEVSYGELVRRADRYGRGLQALGLRPEDTVVALLPNSADLLAVFFAALQTGLYFVPVNWHLVGPEINYIIGDSGAKAFVAHERFTESAQAAVDGAAVPEQARFAVGEIDGFRPLTELGENEPPYRPDGRVLGSPMLYTSGTTGRPKGVRRPLTGEPVDEIPARNRLFFALFDLKPHDGHVHLCGSPLYHAAVLSFGVVSVLYGHPVVLMDGWDAEESLRLIERHGITHSHVVPTQFNRLLTLPAETRARYDLSSLRKIVHGAAPCPPETKRRMIEWLGPVIMEYYAATEGGGAVIDSAQWLAKPGSVGLPWPGSQVRVLDEEGTDRPVGEPGLVYLQAGAVTTFQYHGDPEKTKANRVGELFTMGDIGYLDADGYLFLCDRRNDMIISGGVNIYPAEIEGELAVHPKVADVAVFGIPHPDWGEEVKAVVQPADGVVADAALTEELLAYAGTRLARFKLPRSIDYLDSLPRDPNGKLYKRRLREPYWAGSARNI